MKQEIKTFIHNRFDIYKTNRETGKTEQIAYAENIVLDAMWSRLVNRQTYFGAIQFGTGTGTLVSSRTSLFSFLGAKTAIDDVLTRTVPTASWRRKIVLNPEDNIGAVLTEIGIGYDTTTGHLVTHAMLRDMNGNIVSITKTAVDLLTIYATVYITFTSTDSSLKIVGLPNANPLMNYLVGGANIGNCYFFMGECTCTNADEFTEGLLSPSLGNTAAISWAADIANKKMSTSTQRLAVGDSNGNIKEIVFGSGVGSPIIRLSLPASSIFPGLALLGVPVGTGDAAMTEFSLSSRNIDTSSLKVYLDAVQTTNFTIDKGTRSLIPRFDSPSKTGNGYKTGISFARNTGDMACADQWSSPYYITADYHNGVFVRRTSGPVLPGVSYDTSLSDDGLVLAVSHATSPYVSTFDWTGGEWVKRANPDILPTGTSFGCSLSGDGRVLAVAHASAPYITTYDWDSGIWVKRSNPSTLPTGQGYSCKLSQNGLIMAVAHAISPYLSTYDWTDGEWVKRSNPATLPASTGRSCSLTDDGTKLAIGFGNSPFIFVYEWSDGAWVKRADPTSLPVTVCETVSINRSTGAILAAMNNTSPNGMGGGINPLYVYDWLDGAWVKRANPSTNYVQGYGQGHSSVISPDETVVACGYHDGSPLYSIALYALDVYQTKIIFNTAPASGAVITADYNVLGIHKTTQRVIDLNASFTFGEPI